MLTMRPQRRLTIPGTAALMAWNDEERLMAMMASHFSSGKSSIGATNWMPALLTKMSQAPSADSASAVAMPRPMPLVEPVTIADLPLIMGGPPLSAAIMLHLRDKDDPSPGPL